MGYISANIVICNTSAAIFFPLSPEMIAEIVFMQKRYVSVYVCCVYFKVAVKN